MENSNDEISLENKTVLLIDDEPDILDLVEEILQSKNSVLLKAENGQVGLDIITSQKVDIIISDFKMPIMEGTKLLATIRSLGYDILFILLTGFSKMLDDTVTTTLNCVVMSKPCGEEQLKAVAEAAYKLTHAAKDLEYGTIEVCQKPGVKIDDVIEYRRSKKANIFY